MGIITTFGLLKGQLPQTDHASTEKDGVYYETVAKRQFRHTDSLKTSLANFKKAHYAYLNDMQIKNAISTSVRLAEKYFVSRNRRDLPKSRDSSYVWMDNSFKLYQKWPDSAGEQLPLILRRKGDLLKRDRDYLRADSFFTQSLVFQRKIDRNDTDFFIGCFYSKYFVAYYLNRLDDARRVIDSIKPYCLSPREYRRYFAYQNLSGRYFYMLGQPEKSVYHFTEASKVIDKTYEKNSRQKLLVYEDLYKSYKLLGNREQSKAHLLKAIEVAELRNDEDLKFNLYYALSGVYYEEKKYQEALRGFKKLEAKIDRVSEAQACMALQRQPLIYHLLQKPDSAELAATKLKKVIDASVGEQRIVLINRSASAKSLADYYRICEKYDLAFQYAQKGIDDILKLKGRASAKSSRYMIKARIYQSIDSFEQAAVYAAEAMSFHRISGNSNDPLENEYDINAVTLNGYRFLSETFRMRYQKQKDTLSLYYFKNYSKMVLKCINELNGVVPSGKSKRAYRDKYKLHSENILFTLQESLKGNEYPNLSQASEILKFIEGAKSQELRWKITSDEALSQNMGLPDSLKYRLMYLKAIIANQERRIQSTKDSTEKASLADELIALRDDLKLLSVKIRDGYPSFYRHFYQPKEISLKTILASNAKEETVINYFVGYETVFALGFNRSQFIFKELGHTDTLKQWVTRFNQGIAQNDIEKFKTAASSLYQWLLNPFLELGLDRMVIVPDGMLYSLAFDALLTETTQGKTFGELPYVIKKHFITLCYSADDLLPMSKNQLSTQNTSLLAMGRSFDNDKEKRFAYLPKAIDEVNFSASLFDQGLQFQNEMATENLFKQRASEANIIHCATHALVDQQNPLNSVLVLAGDTLEDGMLHLHEMLNLNLNSSLVVLSACNTGSGYVDTTEGVISLGYAIAYAGCPNSMMTLWSSPDISNSEIVKRTMKLVSEGTPFDKALHLAKLNFLNEADPVMASPLYWSAMNYTGKPDFGIEHKPSYWFFLAALAPFLLLGIVLFRYKS